ncbi:MAG: 30S ribosomal protein S21 [Chitinophagales bacterium]|nr:30S ribosomal protein S21 [Chitinophagales bacterium]
MLIIDVKDSDTIDKALRKYKKKFERTGTLRELRDRKYFTKPSIEKRQQHLKAIYKEQRYGAAAL